MSWNSGIAAIAIVAIAAMLTSPPAAAQDGEPDYARPGFYIGLGAEGAVYLNLEEELEDQLESLGYTEPLDADGATAGSAFVGYRVHRFFSVEAEFEKMAQSGVDISRFEKIAEVEAWALTTNVKFFPLTGRLQPFGLIGVGLLHVDIDDGPSKDIDRDEQRFRVSFGGTETEFAARFGGGVEVYLSEQIVIWGRATYVLPTGDLDDLDYMSFGGGLQFRF